MKKKTAAMTALVFAGSVFAGGQAMAAGDKAKTEQTRSYQESGKTGQAGKTHSMSQTGLSESRQVSNLMEKTVKGKDGKELGSVSDLIVNEQGKIDYLIISKGGVMGMGEDLVPIPWDSVQQTGGEEALTVDIDQNKLENAPTFSENDFQQPGWDSEVRGYYGEGQKEGSWKKEKEGQKEGSWKKEKKEPADKQIQ